MTTLFESIEARIVGEHDRAIEHVLEATKAYALILIDKAVENASFAGVFINITDDHVARGFEKWLRDNNLQFVTPTPGMNLNGVIISNVFETPTPVDAEVHKKNVWALQTLKAYREQKDHIFLIELRYGTIILNYIKSLGLHGCNNVVVRSIVRETKSPESESSCVVS